MTLTVILSDEKSGFYSSRSTESLWADFQSVSVKKKQEHMNEFINLNVYFTVFTNRTVV